MSAVSLNNSLNSQAKLTCVEKTSHFLLAPLKLASGKRVRVTKGEETPSLNKKNLSLIGRLAYYILAFTLWLPFTIVGLCLSKCRITSTKQTPLANEEPKDPYDFGLTPLMIAAKKGDLLTVEALLKGGAEVNKGIKEKKTTPLILAAQENHVEVMRALIKAGWNIDCCNGRGESALYVAVEQGHEESVKLLIDSGANYETKSGFEKMTPLMRAVHKGRLQCVRLLIDKKGNIETTDSRGETPLMLATKKGDIPCLQALIRGGAQIDKIEDERQNTALLLATINNKPAAVDELIKAGANVNQANIDRNTPLKIAAKMGYMECLVLLIKGKANIDDTANKQGNQTPLMLAASHGHVDCVQALLQAGAHPLLEGTDSGPALYYAVTSKRYSERLLEPFLAHRVPTLTSHQRLLLNRDEHPEGLKRLQTYDAKFKRQEGDSASRA